MKTETSLKTRQGGAVAVVVGISIVVLVGFLALVLDLGHLYIAKTELQNASDAAALSGAKELDGTAGTSCTPSCTPSTSCTGVTRAVCMAIATATQNNYDFSKLVDIGPSSPAIISVGSSPTGPWVLASTVTTDAAAADKTFLKVDTGPRQLGTWVAPIFNLITGGNYSFTSTFGMAVAGRFSVKITPIGICAVDVRQCPCLPGESNCGLGNQTCGYEPGKSYVIGSVNPIGPGDPVWIDPTARAPNPICNVDVPHSIPFVCNGTANISTTPGDYVYTNPGLAVPQINALDSRFGDIYPGIAHCDSTTAPPDRNIQEYAYQLFDNVAPAISGRNPYRNQSTIPDWMMPIPNPNPGVAENPQTSVCTPSGTDQYGGNIYNCPWNANGVYWSVRRPDPTVVTTPVTTNSNYPGTGTPYSQTSGSPYFHDGGSGQLAGRRLLNLTILQCTAAGGACRPTRIRMIGQYLLQTRGSVANDINLEFNRTLSQDEILGEVKLYQ